MGADDYIAKPFRARELLSRIKSVLRRTSGSSATLHLGDVEVDPTAAVVRKAGREVQLTALEYRLLLLFAQSQGRLVTREHVRNAIWDSAGEYVSDNTLNVYVKRLRDKIEDDPGRPPSSCSRCAAWDTRRAPSRKEAHDEPSAQSLLRGGARPCWRLRSASLTRSHGHLAGPGRGACGADVPRPCLRPLRRIFNPGATARLRAWPPRWDEVLHGGRRIDFADYREGDVAVLKNELAKMTAALAGATERLGKEKAALADALADVSHQIRTPLTAIGPPGARHRGRCGPRRAHARPARARDARGACGVARDHAPQTGEGRRRGPSACRPRPWTWSASYATRSLPLAGAFDLRGVACEVDVAPGGVVHGGMPPGRPRRLATC